MPKALRVTILGLAVGLMGLAQDQIATVTSTAVFRLRGATITPGEGVPMWPVLAGDTIKAGDAVTIITYTDGSTITIEPGGQGNVDVSGATPSFQLAFGTAVYSLKSKTSLKLFAGDKFYTPAGLTGAYSQNTVGKRGGGFWTPAHTVLVGAAVAGGATGAALGVGVGGSNSAGSQVSPTR